MSITPLIEGHFGEWYGLDWPDAMVDDENLDWNTLLCFGLREETSDVGFGCYISLKCDKGRDGGKIAGCGVVVRCDFCACC